MHLTRAMCRFAGRTAITNNGCSGRFNAEVFVTNSTAIGPRIQSCGSIPEAREPETTAVSASHAIQIIMFGRRCATEDEQQHVVDHYRILPNKKTIHP